MSKAALILGRPGRGKSTSIRTLNPEETFVISCADKELPFKGSDKLYIPFDKNTKKGNYYATYDINTINSIMKYVNDNMPEIKRIVIDDFQYCMTNMLTDRSSEKGFQKYNDIFVATSNFLNTVRSLRNDMMVFVMNHITEQYDDEGRKQIKAKTIGNAIDKYIDMEGMFTMVFLADVIKTTEGKLEHVFITKNDGINTAKTPIGMFEEEYIPNDLEEISNKIINYYND